MMLACLFFKTLHLRVVVPLKEYLVLLAIGHVMGD